MKAVTSSEFMEEAKSGEISGIYMQYADLSGSSFSGLKIRNSKFFFVTLRNCKFRDITFENCEFFFTAFGFSECKNMQFHRCKMEYSGFTGARFDDCRIIDSKLSWHSFVNTNVSGVELRNCTEFRVFRSVDDLTPDLMEQALDGIKPMLSVMDIDMKQKIQYLLSVVKDRLPAEPSGAQYEKAKGGYGTFDSFIDSAITTYGPKPAYKTGKSVYETKREYGK